MRAPSLPAFFFGVKPVAILLRQHLIMVGEIFHVSIEKHLPLAVLEAIPRPPIIVLDHYHNFSMLFSDDSAYFGPRSQLLLVPIIITVVLVFILRDQPERPVHVMMHGPHVTVPLIERKIVRLLLDFVSAHEVLLSPPIPEFEVAHSQGTVYIEEDGGETNQQGEEEEGHQAPR